MSQNIEREIASWSYEEAPVIKTTFPGPKTKELLDKTYKNESVTVVAPYWLPFVWSEARGATIKDPDGNVYIDMMGGVAVNNVGHNHPEVIQTIKKQCEVLMHTADWPSPLRVKLIEELINIAPGDMRGNARVALGLSGSSTAEMSLKFARWYTKRIEIVSFHGGYHGVYTGALMMTTNVTFKPNIPPLVPGHHFVPYPYCYRCPFGKEYPDCGIVCADYVEYVLTRPGTGFSPKPAAVIMEPVQGEGGYVVPPKEFMERIPKVCKENDILFIADEVQCGFCRTGKWFAIENWNVTPDLINMAKALGGDLPVAAVMGRREVMDNIPKTSQPVTFAGNALTCAVAIKNIELMRKYKLDERSRNLGEYFRKLLNELAGESKIIGDVRGLGLMIGVELVEDQKTKKPMNVEKMLWALHQLRDRGVLALICGVWGQVFRFMPPLVITKELIDRGYEIFASVIRELEKKL